MNASRQKDCSSRWQRVTSEVFEERKSFCFCPLTGLNIGY